MTVELYFDRAIDAFENWLEKPLADVQSNIDLGVFDEEVMIALKIAEKMHKEKMREIEVGVRDRLEIEVHKASDKIMRERAK